METLEQITEWCRKRRNISVYTAEVVLEAHAVFDYLKGHHPQPEQPKEFKTAKEIYTECLIKRDIISIHSDTSWQYNDKFDAVMDAMKQYRCQGLPEVSDEEIEDYAVQNVPSGPYADALISYRIDAAKWMRKQLTGK